MLKLFKSASFSQKKKPLLAGVFFVVFLILFFSSSFLIAQSSSDQAKEDLRRRLQEVQSRIDIYSGQIQQRQNEAVSLKREIDNLEDQIKQAQLEIEQTELAIDELNLEINDREKQIAGYKSKIEDKKKVLTECLRTVYEYDQTSLSELILQENNFSDFFNEIQSVESLQTKMQAIVNELNGFKKGVEDQKSELEDQKSEQAELMNLQEVQKISFQLQEQKKNQLLQQTRGQESLFEKLMKKAYSDVSAIKNQLFKLDSTGVSMTFQEALSYAEFAASKTGVRPAFLLAVLKKETSWGTNVGTGSWRSDMKKSDQDNFVEICQKLGFDPDTMPVSRKPSYGWGGAMGPAQFLPSTWQAYENQIAQLTGHNPPNPWSLEDAFTAAAIKLSGNGASAKTYNAEWKAAMVYFAGSRWNNSVYRFYGDSVMDFASTLQQQIDAINGK